MFISFILNNMVKVLPCIEHCQLSKDLSTLNYKSYFPPFPNILPRVHYFLKIHFPSPALENHFLPRNQVRLYGGRNVFRVLFPELWKIKIIQVTSIKKDEKNTHKCIFSKIIPPPPTLCKKDNFFPQLMLNFFPLNESFFLSNILGVLCLSKYFLFLIYFQNNLNFFN